MKDRIKISKYFLSMLSMLSVLSVLVFEQIAHAQEKPYDYKRPLIEVIVPEAVDFRTVEMTANLRFSKFSVSVKNRERTNWSGVKVIFRFPSGREFIGRGVTSIGPGRRSSYTMDGLQLEEAQGELLAAGSKFDVPEVIVSHLVRTLGQD